MSISSTADNEVTELDKPQSFVYDCGNPVTFSPVSKS